MSRIIPIILAALALVVEARGADAGLFLRGNLGWMEGDVYKTDTAGSLYMGGFGVSGEIGLKLKGRVDLSAEYGPSYRQPTRNIEESQGYEDGAYRLTMANLTFRMEPIESLQPYLYFGGGQGIFTFDYGDTGKVVTIGGVERRLAQETLTAWVISAGLGFESPISGWLWWGARGRFLYHRWQAMTDADRFIPYASGNGFSLDGVLTVRF